MADVYGVFSRCFVDCGAEPFTVHDKDGEQLKEVFVNHISPVTILFLQLISNINLIDLSSRKV